MTGRNRIEEMKKSYVMNVYSDESRTVLERSVPLKASDKGMAVQAATLWVRQDNVDYGVRFVEWFGGGFRFEYLSPAFPAGTTRVVEVIEASS